MVANNGHYGLLKQRHMYQYGTTDRQFAKMAVNQRFNALTNPNALFKGQPITVEDVLASRYTNDPIHLLECVMPCIGAAAVVVTSAERARLLPHPPVYVLGAGGSPTTHEVLWQRTDDITVTAVAQSAPLAYQMAGYGPKDMQFAQMYD
ncbi:MAG: thiolase family protein [Dehalococcoidia bacterium]|nr:thiolase family protein [Dehalococcoidia bacterium]